MLGDNHYGIWVVLASLTGWYALLDLGLSLSVSRHMTLYYARGEMEEIRGIARTAYFTYCSLGLLSIVVVALVSLSLRILKPDMPDVNLLCIAILISGGTFAISMPQRLFSGVVNGVMRQDLSGRCITGFRILGGLMTFVLLYFGGRLLSVLVGALIVMVLNTVVFYLIAKRSFLA